MRNELLPVSYRDRESEKMRKRKRKWIMWRHSQKRKMDGKGEGVCAPACFCASASRCVASVG